MATATNSPAAKPATAPPAVVSASPIGAGPPSSVSSSQADSLLNNFAYMLAQQTGLNANVIKAWAEVENSYAPNGTGHYNFLNVRPSGTGGSYSGVPLAGVSSGNFQEFGSLADAVTETAHWINKFGNYSGIRASASQSPASQIAAIAASPWDSGKYAGGGSIVSRYNSLTGSGGGIVSGLESLPGQAAGAVNSGLRHIPGVAQVEGGVSAASDAVSGTAGAISWLSDWNNWLRIGYILGGGVLVLGGVILLARSVGGGSAPGMPSLGGGGGGGSPSPSPAPAKRQGFYPSDMQPKARRVPARAAKPKAGSPGSSKLAAGEAPIPF